MKPYERESAEGKVERETERVHENKGRTLKENENNKPPLARNVFCTGTLHMFIFRGRRVITSFGG